jgi:aerotaxis receptor
VEKIDSEYLESLGINEDYFLISQTDTKGIITGCNKTFSKISGYSEKELIGKPHNIIRDEIMPKEVFEDMWRTIQSGNTWSGYVRNKKSNGRFYWVHAFVFPYKLSDGTESYRSYRRQASTKEIKEAMKKLGIYNAE